jgi:cell division protein FtsW
MTMTSRRTRPIRYDFKLLLAVFALVVLGLIMVYSATFHLQDDSAYYLKRQLLWVLLGSSLLWLTSRLEYGWWRRLALPIMAGSSLSLVAVLFVARGEGETASWFVKGSYQPSEFAKLAFIIYIAAWLASKGDKIRDVTYGLVPFAVLLGAVTGLILLQPDTGTALLIAVTAVTMFFLSGAELSQVFTGLLIGTIALLLVLMRSETALERFRIWWDSASDPSGAGYQVQGVLSALQAGGITGRGLGAGQQKFNPPFLYHTDTILSVIGEELGLLGCLVVIGLFLFVAYRGLVISFRAPDTFSQLLALGITMWIMFQAMVHIGGNTGALPFTGITLPFVSYGGSSLTMCLAGTGLLLSLSRIGVEREIPRAAFAFGRRNGRPRLSGTGRGRGTQKRGKR